MTVLIAGLTLALSLHQIGVGCRVFETSESIQSLGVGYHWPGPRRRISVSPVSTSTR